MRKDWEGLDEWLKPLATIARRSGDNRKTESNRPVVSLPFRAMSGGIRIAEPDDVKGGIWPDSVLRVCRVALTP